jgi:hypothetical protein
MWREWLSKELDPPLCDNLIQYPDALHAMRAFKETLDKISILKDLEEYIKE